MKINKLNTAHRQALKFGGAGKNMKTFKTLKHFENRLKKGICWEDWVKVNGKIFKMEEYGTGQSNDYMRFYNKNNKHTISIDYHCPSYQGGVKIKDYQFLCMYDYTD